jgi:hypothetical protein
MSRHRRSLSAWPQVLSIGALILVGNPGCSDDPSAPEEPSESNVSVESSNRETATIGPSGGSISTTSSAGVTYTLDIPAGAIPGDVEIAITPVTSIDNLPFEGRLEGAVRLGPSGLQLFKPALLTIARAPSTSGTEQLVGFGYEGDADSFEPAAAIDGTTEIRVPITHFSGAGAASSEDPQDWLATLCASAPALDYPFAGQLDACWQPPQTRREWFFQFARDYLEDILTPLAQGSGELSVTVTEYIEWYTGCDALAAQFEATDWEDVLATEIETIQGLIEDELVASIAGEKTALCSQGGVEHLRLLLEYRHLAIAAGFEETTGLRDEDILDGLCAEVRMAEITLADPMPMNQGTSLDARAELWINNQREDAVFNFIVNPVTTNVTCAGGSEVCEGRSNGLGEYSVVVTRTGPGLVELDVSARLLMSLFVTSPSGAGYALTETPLRVLETVVRESASIDVTFADDVQPGEPALLRAVVTRDNPGGSPFPVEGAVVTFTVDGGTADPVGGLTDAAGAIETEITPGAQESRLLVRIDASTNGVPLATRTVERALNRAITLVSRRSTVAVVDFSQVPGCSQSGDPFNEDESFGNSPINASISASCNADGESSSMSANAQIVSDPGVSTDGRSARMTFQSNLNLSTTVTSCPEATNCLGQGVQGDASFEVSFYVNSPVDYQFTMTAQSQLSGDVSNFSRVHLDGPGGRLVSWFSDQGNPSASGTLAVGAYYLSVKTEVVIYPPSGSGTYGMTGSLQLDAAPAAVTRNR